MFLVYLTEIKNVSFVRMQCQAILEWNLVRNCDLAYAQYQNICSEVSKVRKIYFSITKRGMYDNRNVKNTKLRKTNIEKAFLIDRENTNNYKWQSWMS